MDGDELEEERRLREEVVNLRRRADQVMGRHPQEQNRMLNRLLPRRQNEMMREYIENPVAFRDPVGEEVNELGSNDPPNNPPAVVEQDDNQIDPPPIDFSSNLSQISTVIKQHPILKLIRFSNLS